MPQKQNVFLTAAWHNLLVLNYEVDPSCLSRFVPSGTELDSFEGKTYISLVGFQFRDTKFRGRIPIPFHAAFEEINLRFYVRRQLNREIRRGVVFVAEVVPKLAIAKTARWVYGENYVLRAMKQRLEMNGSSRLMGYGWKEGADWCILQAQVEGTPRCPDEGSFQQFITDHYWGYSRQSGGASLEYRVAHPPWRVWSASCAEFTGNPSRLYGGELAQALSRLPASAFVAEGSDVSVFAGNPI